MRLREKYFRGFAIVRGKNKYDRNTHDQRVCMCVSIIYSTLWHTVVHFRRRFHERRFRNCYTDINCALFTKICFGWTMRAAAGQVCFATIPTMRCYYILFRSLRFSRSPHHRRLINPISFLARSKTPTI